VVQEIPRISVEGMLVENLVKKVNLEVHDVPCASTVAEKQHKTSYNVAQIVIMFHRDLR
jgi:hypothetical protein